MRKNVKELEWTIKDFDHFRQGQKANNYPHKGNNSKISQ